MSDPSRRDFLLSSLVFGLSSCAIGRNSTLVPTTSTLDIHVHLFGSGDSGSSCYLSRKVQTGFNFIYLRRMLGIHKRGLGLDRGYAQALSEQIEGCSMDRVAILSQDCVYDSAGRPDMGRTHFFVPNEYLFDFVARHPRKATACVSINPDRRDCIDELERCVARGARLLKIHPPTQGVDLADRKHRKFFQRCADLDILVMVHTGHEHATPVIDIELANPVRMEQGLEQGCRMVACHSGSGWKNDKPDYFGTFVELIGRHPRLYGDTSVMATLARSRDLLRAIDAAPLKDRLVHGSDFPFPSWPLAFGAQIGREQALLLQKETNLIDRDFELKQRLGIGQATALRSHQLVFGKCGAPARM